MREGLKVPAGNEHKMGDFYFLASQAHLRRQSVFLGDRLSGIEKDVRFLKVWIEGHCDANGRERDRSRGVNYSVHPENGYGCNTDAGGCSALYVRAGRSRDPEILEDVCMSECLDPVLGYIHGRTDCLVSIRFQIDDTLCRIYPWCDIGEIVTRGSPDADTSRDELEQRFFDSFNRFGEGAGDGWWTEPYPDPWGTGWMVSYCMTFSLQDGKREGLVAADLSIDLLGSSIACGDSGGGEEYFLLDPRGRILFTNSRRVRGAELLEGEDPLFGLGAAGDTVFFSGSRALYDRVVRENLAWDVLRFSDSDYLLFFAMVPTTGWLLILNPSIHRDMPGPLQELSQGRIVLRTVRSIAHSTASPEKMGSLFETLLTEVMTLVGASSGAIYVRKRNHLAMKASEGLSPAFLGEKKEIEIPSWAGALIVERKHRAIFTPGSVCFLDNEEQVAAWVSYPFRLRDRLIGIMILGSGDEAYFDEERISVVEGIGRQVSVAVGNVYFIDEAKNLEEQYHLLVANSDDVIIHFDHTGKCLFANESVQRWTGLRREDVGSAGNFYRQVVHDDDRPKVLRYLQKAFRKQTSVGEFRIKQREGVSRWVTQSLFPILDEDGELKGVEAIMRDISARREMEDRLLRTEKLCAMGQMASGITHDFNNLLAGILGYVQLLQKEENITVVRKYMQIIEKAAMSSIEMIKKIQGYTRVGGKRSEEFVDLNEVVRTSVVITKPLWRDQPELEGKHIQVEKYLGNIPRVYGNEAELIDLVTNLILNAVKAMPDGGTITIRTGSEGKWIRMIIQDTGKGMDEEVLGKIFVPFFTTEEKDGQGLGLSISYKIIKRHHGKIEVESSPGEGTEFVIKFPKVPERSVSAVVPVKRHPRGARVLIIEDKEYLHDIFKMFAAREDFEATVTHSAVEGIELLRRTGNFDILVTNLGMPEMNGYQMASQAREIDPALSIVLCSGWNKEVDDRRIRKTGIDCVLQKPFTLDNFREVLSEAYQKRKERATP